MCSGLHAFYGLVSLKRLVTAYYLSQLFPNSGLQPAVYLQRFYLICFWSEFLMSLLPRNLNSCHHWCISSFWLSSCPFLISHAPTFLEIYSSHIKYSCLEVVACSVLLMQLHTQHFSQKKWNFCCFEISASVGMCWPTLIQFTLCLLLFFYSILKNWICINSFACVSHIYIKL